MEHLIPEIASNFKKFCEANKADLLTTTETLAKHSPKFLESYRRIVSLQAWRVELLEKQISANSLEFFLEAQNDALTSHVLAELGAWRSALKSLRSCIENVYYAMYYKDHPVELQQWEAGSHRLAHKELASYFAEHPSIKGLPSTLNPIPILSSEYSTLSRAVHGTGKSFRMSVPGVGLQFWQPDVAKLGKWSTRESAVLSALNQFLIALFQDKLSGGQLPNLRKSISLTIPGSRHAGIKSHFKITLFKDPTDQA